MLPKEARIDNFDLDEVSDIDKIQDKYREIMRLKLVHYKDTDIAQILGISKMTVKRVLESELVKHGLKELQGKRDDSAVDVRRERGLSTRSM